MAKTRTTKQIVAETVEDWIDASWNPVTGCTKISPGCKNCYAERMALWLQGIGNAKYANGFQVTLQPSVLDLPKHRKRPHFFFVNSMSDLFHDEVPEEYIQQVFAVMNAANWHRYMMLTRRSQRLLDLDARLPWQPHVWMGVSVESQPYQYRIDHLRQTHAHLKFLCIEPMLGPMPSLDLRGMGWVILGGESGPHARPLEADWVRGVRDQCVAAGVPFCFKQWGGANKRQTGNLLDGRVWSQMPQELVPTKYGSRRQELPLFEGIG